MKRVEYMVNQPLEQVWDASWHFWNTHSNCRIVGHNGHPEYSWRCFKASHGASMTSWGENYTFWFMRIAGSVPSTRITVDVELAFGYGMQWLKANGLLNEWAYATGPPPVDFAGKYKWGWVCFCGLCGLCFIVPTLLMY